MICTCRLVHTSYKHAATRTPRMYDIIYISLQYYTTVVGAFRITLLQSIRYKQSGTLHFYFFELS